MTVDGAEGYGINDPDEQSTSQCPRQRRVSTTGCEMVVNFHLIGNFRREYGLVHYNCPQVTLSNLETNGIKLRQNGRTGCQPVSLVAKKSI